MNMATSSFASREAKLPATWDPRSTSPAAPSTTTSESSQQGTTPADDPATASTRSFMKSWRTHKRAKGRDSAKRIIEGIVLWAFLETPRTPAEIEHYLDREKSTVQAILRDLRAANMVSPRGFGPKTPGRTGNQPFLWGQNPPSQWKSPI